MTTLYMWKENTGSDSIYTYEIQKTCKVCACVGFLLDCYGYCVHCAKCFSSVTEKLPEDGSWLKVSAALSKYVRW